MHSHSTKHAPLLEKSWERVCQRHLPLCPVLQQTDNSSKKEGKKTRKGKGREFCFVILLERTVISSESSENLPTWVIRRDVKVTLGGGCGLLAEASHWDEVVSPPTLTVATVTTVAAPNPTIGILACFPR